MTVLPRQHSTFPVQPAGRAESTEGTATITRLQGFELHGNPCVHPPGVTPTVGADPLLDFQLPGVFAPPAMTTPFMRSPLAHFIGPDTEAAVSTVPQSISEQEIWLASLEAADPSEVLVLIPTCARFRT
jgi:hypothetical protein